MANYVRKININGTEYDTLNGIDYISRQGSLTSKENGIDTYSVYNKQGTNLGNIYTVKGDNGDSSPYSNGVGTGLFKEQTKSSSNSGSYGHIIPTEMPTALSGTYNKIYDTASTMFGIQIPYAPFQIVNNGVSTSKGITIDSTYEEIDWNGLGRGNGYPNYERYRCHYYKVFIYNPHQQAKIYILGYPASKASENLGIDAVINDSTMKPYYIGNKDFYRSLILKVNGLTTPKVAFVVENLGSIINANQPTKLVVIPLTGGIMQYNGQNSQSSRISLGDNLILGGYITGSKKQLIFRIPWSYCADLFRSEGISADNYYLPPSYTISGFSTTKASIRSCGYYAFNTTTTTNDTLYDFAENFNMEYVLNFHGLEIRATFKSDSYTNIDSITNNENCGIQLVKPSINVSYSLATR